MRDDALYPSVVGDNFAGVLPRSLNVAGQPALLGILEFDAGLLNPPQPDLRFDGVTSLPGVTAAFVASDGTSISVGDVRTISGFDPGDDGDGDGTGDETDNCPHTPNGDQANNGQGYSATEWKFGGSSYPVAQVLRIPYSYIDKNGIKVRSHFLIGFEGVGGTP